MLVKTYCAAVNGLEVTTVTVEVSLNRGVQYHLTGLGDEAVRESRDRVAAALRYSGFKFPIADITINLAPANLRKEGSSFDLPLAIGIMGANENIPDNHLKEYMMVGELSLDGTLQPIKGALPIAIRARAEHYKGLIVPEQNAREAAVVNNLEVYGMKTLFDVIQFLSDRSAPEPTIVDTRKEFYENQIHCDYDYADVRGQENVKRALEVAAAGGHNLIMVGPPGSGKSMMAKRLPSILPPLTLSESLETTQIHSIAGKLGKNVSLIAQRPFRAPHHTISQVALVGGGTSPQPGEISLAHNGVLFCDELPEFSKTTLEVLRQPLEDRHINISRAKYSIDYPCSFMFVASMNPCPCGYYGDPTHRCVCTPGQIQRYMNKISGPLLDRIDIQCEISPVPFKDISKAAPGEPSANIRERVIRASSQIQRLQRHPLQRSDDRANDSPVCRAKRRRHQPPAHGNGETITLCPCLQPNSEGGTHHCRPGRKRACRATASGRSHRIPHPGQRRLGRKRTLLDNRHKEDIGIEHAGRSQTLGESLIPTCFFAVYPPFRSKNTTDKKMF